MRLTALTLTTSLLAVSAAQADAPNVVADIPAVHSLVAQIMDGVGEPSLLMPPGASPHGYAMKPSEAAALQEADMVFWIGEDLTPWLHDSIDSIAAKAVSVELLEAEGTETLEFRETALFEDGHDDHGHGGHDHDKDHAHGEHDHDKEHAEGEHDHDKDHAHGEHDHGKEHAEGEHDHDKEHAKGDHDDHHGHGHEGHDHDGVDPHAWLDPQNGAAWLRVIAAKLSEADPDNAATYFANLNTSLEAMEALSGSLSATVAPAQGKPFVVFHDAYQYFEHRFDVETAGAISLGDAAKPSAQRVEEIKHLIEEKGVLCVFSEPQFEPKLVQTVIEGTPAKSAVLDPLGADIPLGKNFYGKLLTGLATSMAGCLSS
jgi:zinc transport system substrate-binding protein